ncbi:MAG: hypothetical protein ACO1SX_09435 [Actinomycetota bacterium]
MLLEGADDRDRLRAVLSLLSGSEPLECDTVSWLRRAIRGHYGGEGCALDISSTEEAEFWAELQRRYPENAALCLTAADARYLSGSGEPSETLQLFARAFELEPSRVFDVEGEASAALQESEIAPEYWTAYTRALLEREGAEALAEWLPELREIFADDPDGLRRVEQALQL